MKLLLILLLLPFGISAAHIEKDGPPIYVSQDTLQDGPPIYKQGPPIY